MPIPLDLDWLVYGRYLDVINGDIPQLAEDFLVCFANLAFLGRRGLVGDGWGDAALTG